MPDLAKVIKGLEHVQLNMGDANLTYCQDCPYYTAVDCEAALMLDALKLLKEQEPRVLTLYEVRTAEDCMEPVFLEMNAERETPDVFSWRTVKHIVPLNDEDIYVLDNVGFSSALYSEYYGITWRCWNKRPTYEQKKEAKWDESQ